MKNLKNNIYFKIIVLVLISLLLLIPTSMVKRMIVEREQTQQMAIREVSSKWAEAQSLIGPFISIPYYKYIKQFSQKDSVEKVIQIKEYLHFLPDQLNVCGNINPEKRYRGIYEIVVYNSTIKLEGKFSGINFADFAISPKDILFDKAEFVLGISDLRGIEKQVDLNWNQEKIPFNSGVSSNDVVRQGINASLELLESKMDVEYNFSMDLDLKGSHLLYFTPVGKTTDISVNSEWKNPSFNGAFLPDNRKVSDLGFEANWNILHLNRNYPQSWQNSKYAVRNSSFGIDLLLPIDNYRKSYRSIQYAILFIGFTFLCFFFIETLNKIFIHPIQYILVGVSLIVFYTLLLSLSEHIKYNLAFMISALATLLLIYAYVRAILKSKQLSLFILGILTVLYAFIFTIIQLQDYALIIGSIGIFVILAGVMYFSRKIDWYELNLKEKN